MNKDTLKKKSFWVGIATAAYGVYMLTQGEPDGGAYIAAGLAMMAGRDTVVSVTGK